MAGLVLSGPGDGAADCGGDYGDGRVIILPFEDFIPVLQTQPPTPPLNNSSTLNQ